MRQGNQIDLRTRSGARDVLVAPGASVQYVVNAEQSRIGAGGGSAGLYNYARGIVLECFINMSRTSGEGSVPIWADDFPRVLKSINFNTPMDGTLIDPTIMNGMVAYHLHDFVGNGYLHEGIAEQPIPVTTGTYTRYFALYIPWAQKWNPWPDHFAKWLGWLNEGQLETFVEDAANPFGAEGAGTDVINSVTIRAGLDMVPWPEIIIPPDIQLRRYEVSASASSNGPTLINVGSAGALQGVEDGSRLVGMFFSHDSGGFVGSGTADQISTTTLAWRDQRQTLFTDMFYLRWLQTSHLRPLMGFDVAGGTASDGVDSAEPYPMPLTAQLGGAITAGGLASPNSRYTPLVWPERDGLVTFFQKVKGNYPIDMVFSAAQSNVFRVYTLELKQRSLDKVSEMLASMGVNPSTVTLVPKLGRKNFKKISDDKLWGLPRSVVAKGSTK